MAHCKLENLRYRRDARVISVIDIIISSLQIGFLSLALYFFIREDLKLNREDNEGLKLQEVLAIITIITSRFIINIFQLVVAFILFFASAEGKDSLSSLSSYKLWIWNSAFIIVTLILQIILISRNVIVARSSVSILVSVGEMAFRLLGLLFVRESIREINQMARDLKYSKKERTPF